MKLYDVPLFPLNTVLFPQMILPLHIFEPRYRQMIGECVNQNQPFGVLLIEEGPEAKEDPEGRLVSERPTTFYKVGTLARITEVTRLDDGRMLINTVGTERFRLLEYRENKAYLTGDIEIWPDGALAGEETEIARLVNNVTQAFQNYLELLMALANKRIEGLEIPEEPALLSYLIPHWLPQIRMEDKQRLLEVSGPQQRLDEEMLLLARETEFLHKIKQRAEQEANPAEEAAQEPDRYPYNISRRFSEN